MCLVRVLHREQRSCILLRSAVDEMSNVEMDPPAAASSKSKSPS